MVAQPTGTVTLLFTDIEGSTSLLERLGTEAYGRALDLHRRVLRDAFAKHGGYEVNYEGDSFFVAFRSARAAAGAAVDAQRALAAAEWPDGGTIRVRMGLHTGEPVAAPPKYVGLDVHKAARLMAAGHGGQVLVSRTTRDLLGEFTLRDLGEHLLKDFPSPEQIFELQLDDTIGDFPPLRTVERRVTNLPLQQTALLGREQTLAELEHLVGDREHRLVTLTGPGGIGKTRLALQTAANLSERFADGVWLVLLAPIRDPALVLGTIAQTLSVREQPGEEIAETLADYLRSRDLLLVVDNFEQVLDAGPGLAELLRAAPNLSVLATSREPLRLSGELLYEVPPLALPHEGDVGDEIGDVAAVQLFAERAHAVDRSFALTRDTAEATAAIVQRLDGLPLAIELAAARIRSMPPATMLVRLDDRLKLLTGGRRDQDERQQTLRATIRWSYDLLSETEQQLFARLGVFIGGCRVEAAESVCDPDGTLDVLDGLASLVDKSLVRRRDDPDGQARYWLLETIREYAAAALPDDDGAVDRHVAYFAGLAEEVEMRSRTGDHAAEYARLDTDVANLRAALTTADPTARVRLAAALWSYWAARGEITEGMRALDDALAEDVALPPGALVGLTSLRQLAGFDVERNLVEARNAVAQAETAGDDYAQAQGWSLVGRLVASGLGRHAESEPAFDRALALADAGGYRNIRAEVVGWLMIGAVFGPLPVDQGIARCEEFFQAAHDDPTTRAFAQVELAALEAMRGNTAAARERLAAGHEAFLALGLNVWAANNAQEAFYVEMLAGDSLAAAQVLQESYAALEKMGERGFQSTIAGMLAHALYAQGELDEALEYTERSRVAAASDDVYSQVLYRTARAKVHAARGRFDEAVELAQEALALASGTDLLDTTAGIYADLAEVLTFAGRYVEAQAALDEALVRYEQKGHLVGAERTRARRREIDAAAS